MLEKSLANLCGAINGFEAVGMLEGTENVRTAMHAILEHAVKSARIKDEFEYLWSPGVQTIMVVAESRKTGAGYEFYYDHWYNTLHFKSFIQHPYHLKNLQDVFLVDFFKVFADYGFQYQQNAFSPTLEKRFPDLHRKTKSNFFQLMRNYFLFVTEEDFNIKNFDLGYFEASWTFEKDVETIFDELALALKWFYKFNYQLWKFEDLVKKRSL